MANKTPFIKIIVIAFDAAAITLGCQVILEINKSVAGVDDVTIGRFGPTTTDSHEKDIIKADQKAAKAYGIWCAKVLNIPCVWWDGAKEQALKGKATVNIKEFEK